MSKEPNAAFERLASEKEPSLLKEFISFLRFSKKWWLLPLVVLGLILGILLFLGNTGIAPFIYTLF